MNIFVIPVTCDLCKENKNVSKYKCPKCGVNYCSVKCFRSNKHANCYEEFRMSELNSILKLNGTDTSSMDFSEIEEKLQLSKRVNDNIDTVNNNEEALSYEQNCISSDYLCDNVWNKLKDNEKKLFKDFVSNLNTNKDHLVRLQPWWMVGHMYWGNRCEKSNKFCQPYDSDGNMDTSISVKNMFSIKQSLENIFPLYEIFKHDDNSTYSNELHGESIPTANNENILKIYNDILPTLSLDIGKLSLSDLIKSVPLKYNNNLALSIHRILLFYVSCIRIYGNRIEGNEKLIAKTIKHFNRCLNPSVKPDASSFEKMIMNFEVDILKHFHSSWNYAGFKISEEFFIETYDDYLLLLNECDFETKIPFIYYALSDLYEIFRNQKSKHVSRKIIFYMAWCKHYYKPDQFLQIIDFLKFRTAFHREIVMSTKFSEKSLNCPFERKKPLIEEL